MKLVWTYNILAKVGNKTEERKTILINYYIISITNAKKLGYYCIIYTDSFSAKYFKDLVDEIHVVDNYENSVQWDCYKILALEQRNDDFVLIDGDVILHSKLPDFNEDVIFDTYEVMNWKIEYEPVVNQFEELGIGEILEEWDSTKKPVFSCGILYFKDDKYKKHYVKQWKKYNNFLNEKLKTNTIDVDVATMVGGQYLVTLIANHFNLTTSHLTSVLGAMGPYYKHHCGHLKYNNPIVPNDHIIQTAKKILV
jgi:hypothetical protein